jgi:PBSX family phage terminase large subunit
MTVTLPVHPGAVTPDQKPYRPYGTMRDLWSYHGREVLAAGPAGTGKSRGALEKLHACAAREFPGMRGLICRKVRASLTQTALVTFEKKVLPDRSGVHFHHEDQEYRYPNGSVIAVGGLDDPEKIKSSDYDMIYVQEATELSENDWEIAVTRLRNGVMPYQQILADCNPGPPDHWLKKRADAGAVRMIEANHQDNPTLWNRATGAWTTFGAQYMAALDSLTGYLYKRLRLGLWVAAEGMYFEDWDPQVHVCKAFDPPADWPRWLAVDWGFADPFCCLWFARVPKDGTIYVYRELYAAGLRDEQQAELIKQRSYGETINLRILDPSMFNERTESNRPSIASVYANICGTVYPGMNARKPGWAIVRNAMATTEQLPDGTTITKAPRLRVMRERCPNLLRTLPAMVKDPLDPEDLADKVNGVKTEDHACDTLRYGLVAEAQPPTPGKQKAAFGGRG